MKHELYFDKAIDNSLCKNCGHIANIATREQYLAKSNRYDAIVDSLPLGASFSSSIGMSNLGAVPVYILTANTSQGLAEYRLVTDELGNNLRSAWLINHIPVDSIPSSFRKFWTAWNSSLLLIVDYALADWVVIIAEDNGYCVDNIA